MVFKCVILKFNITFLVVDGRGNGFKPAILKFNIMFLVVDGRSDGIQACDIEVHWFSVTLLVVDVRVDGIQACGLVTALSAFPSRCPDFVLGPECLCVPVLSGKMSDL